MLRPDIVIAERAIKILSRRGDIQVRRQGLPQEFPLHRDVPPGI